MRATKRLLLAVSGSVTVVAVAAIVVRSGSQPTRFVGDALYVAAPGDVGTDKAEAGTVYNVGITLTVRHPVTLLSAKARTVTPGLDQVDPLLGYGCKGMDTIYLASGVDLNRTRPHTDVRPLAGQTIDGRERNGTCWYLLLRFRPTKPGTFYASSGELVYRVGDQTRTATYEFQTDLTVP